jgi:hypothetical protein
MPEEPLLLQVCRESLRRDPDRNRSWHRLLQVLAVGGERRGSSVDAEGFLAVHCRTAPHAWACYVVSSRWLTLGLTLPEAWLTEGGQ